jgi:aminomethyltransferase
MVPFAGWHMPVQYAGVKAEHLAVRGAVGLFDVSHMGEIELSGSGALALVDHIITNRVAKLVDGQALYTCACNDQGMILDDLIVYRHAADRLVVVCNASNREKIVDHFRTQLDLLGAECSLDDASDRTALLALQGPKAFDVLAALGAAGAALADLGFFRLTQTTLADVPCTVARTGYTGEDGVEIFCPSDGAVDVWRALLAHGADAGIQPCGLAARDTLRLEARLSLYGNDIDETTHPLEAGLGWVVKLKDRDFIGRDALAKIRADGPVRKLIGFEMVGRGIARQGYPLQDEAGASLGVCTSGSPAPSLGKSIGLGYVPTASSDIGSKLFVDCRGRAIEAVVVATPFYKRGNSA